MPEPISAGGLDADSTRYAHAVHAAVAGELGDELVGLYLYGSAATGSYVGGQSDVDALVVVRDWLDPVRVRRLLDRVLAVPRSSAVKGLDMWIVPADAARAARPDPPFVAWLLTAIDSELVGGPEHPGDARLVLLFAMCRDHGVALSGPPPRSVFGPLERAWIVDAMRVDLALGGASGWYRVLNACRTLHFLEEGSMCGKLEGAAWARERVADPALVDGSVVWRRHGSGPPLAPGRVDAFVTAVAARLNAVSSTAVPAGIPAAEWRPRTTVVHERPLVTCVLVAPSDAELLSLSVRRFAEQDWVDRELVVLRPPGAAHGSALPTDARIRAVGAPGGDPAAWRRLALHEGRGALLAAWDPATWYARDRLSQQVRELLSTSTPRVVTPSLLAYDPLEQAARRVREPELLERATLCAHRHAWGQTGGPARLGERADIAVLLEPSVVDTRGEPAPAADAQRLLGEQLGRYAVAVAGGGTGNGARRPAVSCLMPTYNRRRFAEQAIRLFLAQDYANRELVILDDGEDPIGDLVPAGQPIRYHRLPERATIGRKRELACELADGDLYVQWDDDDWYGTARLRRQIAPLAAGSADIAGILQGYLLDLGTLRFWRGEPPLHEGELHGSIVAGTLAFTEPAWRSVGGYPDRSIGEEVAVLRAVIDQGGRVAPLVNDGIYVCVRHATNSWRLRFDPVHGPPGWNAVGPPDFLPPEDMAFYEGLEAASSR